MKRITTQTEKRLMSVVEKTASLVSNGMAPNNAVAKTASEAGLSPSEIQLVVHAYNTGRTTRQRTVNDSLLEKAADFDMADTSVVLEELYPTKVKSAADITSETVISDDYSYSPGPMLERKHQLEKSARAADWSVVDGERKPSALPQYAAPEMEVTFNRLDRLRKEAEEARRKAASAFDQLNDHFTELTDYFRRPDAHPLPVVKEAVILMHGGVGEKIMDQVIQHAPELQKLANHFEGESLLGRRGRSRFNVTVDSLDCTAEPFDKIAQFIQQALVSQELTQAYETAVQVHDKEAAEKLGPFANPAVSPSILDTSSDERDKVAFMSTPIGLAGSFMLANKALNTTTSKLKQPDVRDDLSKLQVELNDPAHEQKLRAISTQSMLQDLMLNDPVISGYSPDEVTGAYNDLVQVSPSIGDQKLIVQNLLRKQLAQGQLDTFEQDQLLKFEDSLRRQSVPMAGSKYESII